jgi:hypothetical protein
MRIKCRAYLRQSLYNVVELRKELLIQVRSTIYEVLRFKQNSCLSFANSTTFTLCVFYLCDDIPDHFTRNVCKAIPAAQVFEDELLMVKSHLV